MAEQPEPDLLLDTQTSALADWSRIAEQLRNPDLATAVHAAGAALVASLDAGGKVLLAGNGGSAAEASHLAAEFIGRCTYERSALPAVALNDISAITAVSNDYGFDEVFVRGVEALGSSGDVFVGFSTSGTSVNVIKGLLAAKSRGLTTIAMTGPRGRAFAAMADHGLVAPAESTPRIQEVHLLWGHIWCEAVDRLWSRPQVVRPEARDVR